MQTILGANGVIGFELAHELHRRGIPLRLVSRTPAKRGLNEELVAVDLLDAKATRRAVQGTSVVYLTVGLPYDVRVWKAQWPVIIRNVLAACKEHQSRLVFFDNVYMYGLVQGWMTEQSPLHPVSEKGQVRVQVADLLLQAARAGEVDVRIARSADFYGPGARTGIPNILIFDPLAKGGRPKWLGSATRLHSLTYTRDAARATAELGLRDTLPRGQRVWHLPTDSPALTAEQWVQIAARELGRTPPPKIQILSAGMLRVAGLFQRTIKELVEMLYQYDQDYLFSSEAFEKEFGLKPTPYAQGIAETMRRLKEASSSARKHSKP